MHRTVGRLHRQHQPAPCHSSPEQPEITGSREVASEETTTRKPWIPSLTLQRSPASEFPKKNRVGKPSLPSTSLRRGRLMGQTRRGIHRTARPLLLLPKKEHQRSNGTSNPFHHLSNPLPEGSLVKQISIPLSSRRSQVESKVGMILRKL